MPDEPVRSVPGRAVVARRALAEIVRDAVLGSYGVTGFSEPNPLWRTRRALRLGSGAVRLRLHPEVTVAVRVTVAYGLPVAEVARQVDSAVRYGLERAVGHPVGPIEVHVEGLGRRPFTSLPSGAAAAAAPDTPVAEEPAADSGHVPVAVDGGA
jgi:uncharacterized alkaline shock family protein YloU